jgi:hypothetical protein
MEDLPMPTPTRPTSPNHRRHFVQNPGLTPPPKTDGEWAFALALDAKRMLGHISRFTMDHMWTYYRSDARYLSPGKACIKAIEVCHGIDPKNLRAEPQRPTATPAPARRPVAKPAKPAARPAWEDDDTADYRPCPALDSLTARSRQGKGGRGMPLGVEHKAILPGW